MFGGCAGRKDAGIAGGSACERGAGIIRDAGAGAAAPLAKPG